MFQIPGNSFLELKDGHVPHGLANHLGNWKAEEYQKFSFPASEVILSNFLQPDDYHLWQLTCRMTELVFNKRNGWMHEHAQLFHKLAKRYSSCLKRVKESKPALLLPITCSTYMKMPWDFLIQNSGVLILREQLSGMWPFHQTSKTSYAPLERGNLTEKFWKLSVLTVFIRLQADLGYKPRP